jgi:AcrR family transcriptional regulator
MPQSGHRPRPRWHRRPEARHEEIIAAATAAFAAAGFARTSLDDVARRAKVSKGTLYRYFDSKEALFRAMVRANVATVLAAGEDVIRNHQGSSRELLALLTRRMWHTMRDPAMARVARLVQSELHEFPELALFYFDEVMLRGRHMIQSVLDRGLASGEFRADPHGFAARGLSDLMVFSAQTQRFFATMDPERLGDDQVLDGILDLFLHGVEAR